MGSLLWVSGVSQGIPVSIKTGSSNSLEAPIFYRELGFSHLLANSRCTITANPLPTEDWTLHDDERHREMHLKLWDNTCFGSMSYNHAVKRLEWMFNKQVTLILQCHTGFNLALNPCKFSQLSRLPLFFRMESWDFIYSCCFAVVFMFSAIIPAAREREKTAWEISSMPLNWLYDL